MASYKKGGGSKVRNDHADMKSDSSGRALNNSHRSCFSDTPQYGKTWSDRQKKIIDGTYTGKIYRKDITLILRKADYLGAYDIGEKVYEMYGYFYHEPHPDDYTLEESTAILDSLTPDDLK